MNSAAPRRVVIVGLGVMGGSVAKSLGRRAPRTAVFGIDPDDESAALAARDGVVRAPALEECDPDGAVVVFAAPLDVTAALVLDKAHVWSRASLATDVAGLKVPVMEAAREGVARLAAVRSPAPAGAPADPRPARSSVFVGAHPMCGSERAGYAAARDDLFEGADVWLCPPRRVREPDGGDSQRGSAANGPLALAHAFWRLLGARPRTIAPEEHDRLMVWASHLPQLLSSALAWSLEDAGVDREALGPGGRGMTRLAGSGESMWLPLLEAARKRDAHALGALEERIGTVRRMLEEGDMAGLARLLKKGRRWASKTD